MFAQVAVGPGDALQGQIVGLCRARGIQHFRGLGSQQRCKVFRRFGQQLPCSLSSKMAAVWVAGIVHFYGTKAG